MNTIYIMGAPGSGKTSFARALADGPGAVLSTDGYLESHTHAERPTAIAAAIAETTPKVVEGCEVDRLIKHGLIPPGSLVICMTHKSIKRGCEGLTARAQKYFAVYDGPKYLAIAPTK